MGIFSRNICVCSRRGVEIIGPLTKRFQRGQEWVEPRILVQPDEPRITSGLMVALGSEPLRSTNRLCWYPSPTSDRR